MLLAALIVSQTLVPFYASIGRALHDVILAPFITNCQQSVLVGITAWGS